MSRKDKLGAEGGWAGYPPGYRQPGQAPYQGAPGTTQPGLLPDGASAGFRSAAAADAGGAPGPGPAGGTMAPMGVAPGARPAVADAGTSGPVASRRGPGVAGPVVFLAALGAVIGLIWSWLAPTGTVVYTGSEWLPADPGLWFGQDIWYAGMTAAAGLITGAILAARAGRPRPVWRFVWLLAGSVAGAWLALVVARAIDPVPAAAAAGTEATSGLELHAQGFFLLWPLFACATAAVMLIIRGLRGN